ncbi:hypothetical protein [Plasticicumulans acidivorans]|uniref:Uncharacterized protein n=1 Tax=Plasticicumulans acidivorans TaxID=886464 RepID=A0A317N0J8_9GAMM|nr:hypothetical protein [Plasticicumulans acidivorans]PWV65996.1 hypothetical protein C7443_101484 [Plasticicumulans acidivorans]
MPITDDSITYYASQRMTDYDDGGGLPSPTVIVFGAENGIWPDLAELDFTGVVNVRSIFAIAATADDSEWYRAYSFIAQPPISDDVSIALLPPGAWDDTRVDVVGRSTNELLAASYFPGFLMPGAGVGSRQIQIWQQPGNEAPVPGDVLVLQSASAEQYVRVAAVESAMRTRVDDKGEYARTVLTVTLSDDSALESSFTGTDIARADPQVASLASVVRVTLATGAARLWGIAATTAPIALGSPTVQVERIRQPLVPSATTETAIASLQAGASRAQLVQAGGVLRLASGVTGSVIYLARAITPGTVTISGTATLVDLGDGTAAGSGLTATIDYASGTIRTSIGGTWHVDAAPAARVVGVVDTAETAVTTGNRGYTYAYTAEPPPAPGTVSVSYLSDGTWLTLADDGAGTLSGAGGAGSVSYVDGDILPSLAALPDLGSSIVYQYAVAAEYTRRDGGSVILDARHRVELPAGLQPGSVSASWTSAGVARTLVVGSDGVISGHASGSLVHGTGIADVVYAYLPDPGSMVHWLVERRAVSTGTLAATHINATSCSCTLPAPAVPIRPGGLRVTLRAVRLDANPSTTGTNDVVDLQPSFWIEDAALIDDGAGRLLWGGVDVGSVDYATGDIVISLSSSTARESWLTYYSDARGKELQTRISVGTLPSIDAAPVVDYWSTIDASADADELYAEAGPLRVALPVGGEEIVSGSLSLNLSGDRYWESGGVVYRALVPTSGAATAVGVLDAAAGVVTITVTPGTPVSSATLEALLTRSAVRPTTELVGYVPSRPLKGGVTQIHATATDGTAISATDDGSGVLATGLLRGTIDVDSGLYRLRFGDWLAVASLTPDDLTAAWYSADLIVGDQIWRPRAVLPETVRLTTVAVSSVPLSSDQVGMPSTRLPIDGQLPIFRAGDAVLVHYTHETTGGMPAAGTVINLGYDRLQRVRVLDAAGQRVSSTLYTVDLDAGLLTWVTPLDLTGHSAPYSYQARIADVIRCRRVDVDGTLTLMRAVSHDYPAGSFVSTLQEHGTLQPRTSYLHAQQTWTGVWSDEVIGAAAALTYDDAAQPIAVTGAGAVEEHWRITLTDSAGNVKIYGRALGLVALGNVNDGLSPINDTTGVPYWSMAAAGFSLDRTVGSTIIFRTHPCGVKLALVRTVDLDASASGVDSFKVETAGGVDV